MPSIQLVTELPGPKSKAMIARRTAAMPGGLARSTDIAVESASGALVRDVDGNTLLDFAGGIGMLAAGHCPPEVTRALHQQTDQLLHVCSLVATYEPYVELAELLNQVTPGDFPKKTLLSNSGSEAVENAIKLARTYTGRAGVLCFEGGYHGRTLLTLSLTSKYGLFKKGFGPYASEIYRIAAPNVYRRPVEMTEESYVRWCIEALDRALIAQIDPSALAAIIIEPVQGEAGFIPMPAAFLQRIREICDQHGIVMIADEIQCGMGRTGRLFAIEHYGIVPDLITTAKSLGSGLPIAATVGRAEILDAPHLGGVGGTYGGSPIACVAATESIRLINTPAFLTRAEAVGQRIRERLEALKARCPLVGDVRGLGAMMLIEFVADRSTREPLPTMTLDIIRAAVSRGLLLIRAGLYSNCVRFLPPLVITDEQLDEGLDHFEQAVLEVVARHTQANA